MSYLSSLIKCSRYNDNLYLKNITNSSKNTFINKSERQSISDRTAAALARKRSQGVKLGRKEGYRQLEEYKTAILEYRKKGLGFESIAKLVGSTRQTVSAYLKEIA